MDVWKFVEVVIVVSVSNLCYASASATTIVYDRYLRTYDTFIIQIYLR